MFPIFIDGQEGTTGLQIQSRLAGIPDISLIAIDPEQRKNPEAKRLCLEKADVAILCLHDEAAKQTVQLVDELKAASRPFPRLIDASTAHRVHPDWVYGFPELCAQQAERIQKAERVANPGCYATGAIALIRPLIDAGVLSPQTPLCLPSVSGYSGGGRVMISAYEKGEAPPFELYALGLQHKHIPEIMQLTGLQRRPLFVPSVADFPQGMLVQLPLYLSTLNACKGIEHLYDIFCAHYADQAFIEVHLRNDSFKLEAQACANTNQLEIFVFGEDALDHALLVARLDNLGKGASGAAVQNLQLMLGL